MENLEKALLEHLAFIYGEQPAAKIQPRLLNRLAQFRAAQPHLMATSPKSRLDQTDAILITYGDNLQTGGQSHLQTLKYFLEKYTSDLLSSVHILPFYPYSSDDGFSVIDYFQVDPNLGNWADVDALGENFRLMMDAVVNHISAQSEWFRGFLAGEAEFEGYFSVVGDDFDTGQVFRPRALPLLTEFETASGPKKVWTTFSPDQIDLNYANPEVLLAVIEVLLKYVAEGAEFVRLDAIGFIWKESGTRCLHQPECHRIIQLLRTVLDLTAPQVSLITETNVPHAENISYFGDGSNEAQMVYNFTLPPLTLHTIHSGDASQLTAWAKTLASPSDETTFFNFLASHDGVGLMPVRGILDEAEIDKMARRTEALGGFVSYKNNPDGSQMAYEMNINYLDALGDPENPAETLALKAARFLCAQAIMLALRGVPGIYIHSLLGSQGWPEGVEITGRNRTINREKLQIDRLESELAEPGSLRNLVFEGFRKLLLARKNDPAFHPMGRQQVLEVGPAIFGVVRRAIDGSASTICLQNVSAQSQQGKLNLIHLLQKIPAAVVDQISSERFEVEDRVLYLTLAPYQVRWLKIL